MKKKTPTSSVKLSYCVLNSLDLCEKEIQNKPIPPLRISEMKYIYCTINPISWQKKCIKTNGIIQQLSLHCILPLNEIPGVK